MAVGSIHQYFDSKEALFAATLHNLASEFEQTWQRGLATAADDPAERLRAFAMAYFHPAVCTKGKVAVWFAFWGEVKARPDYRKVCEGFDSRHDDVLRRLAEDLIVEGGADRRTPAAAAKTIAALCQGLWLEFLTGSDGLSARDLAELALLSLGALFPSSAPHFGLR